LLFSYLEQISFSEFTECFSLEPDDLALHLFGVSVDRNAFDSFSADTFGQQASLDADSVSAARNVAILFRFSAPDIITSVEYSAFDAFERRTGRRTGFCLSQ